MVIDFLTYKYHGRKVDAKQVGVAMGSVIDDVMRDQMKTDMTIARAQELAQLRAIEKAAKGSTDDKWTICKGCGDDIEKGGRYHDCCSSICFRDSHC